MIPWKAIGSICCLSLLALMVPQRAVADDWNEKTILTFSGPFELPGVTLPAGTYVFKLIDPIGDHHAVRVFDKTETHIYATLLTIPEEHVQPAGKPVVALEQRAAGTPEAIKAWFYPGNTFGEEFVYPKVRPAQLSKADSARWHSLPDATATVVDKPEASAKRRS